MLFQFLFALFLFYYDLKKTQTSVSASKNTAFNMRKQIGFSMQSRPSSSNNGNIPRYSGGKKNIKKI